MPPTARELPKAARGRVRAGLLPVYCVLVAYGTLFPISGWGLPADFDWRSLLLTWPEHISSTDVFTNILLYIPLGAIAVWRRPHSRFGLSILGATLLGAGLSYGLECLQILLPRVSSRLDLLTNALGSLAGGVGGALTAEGALIGEKLRDLRRTWFVGGRVANVGLLALSLWVLSHWAPLVPSLDIGNLKDGVRPLWNFLRGFSEFDALHAAEYLLGVLGLGLMTATVTRTRLAAAGLWSAAVCLVLAVKVPIITRQLSLEALVGSGAALALLPFALMFVPRRAGAVFLISGTVLVQALRPTIGLARDTGFQPINWVPLAIHQLNLFDLIDLVGGLWPFVALAYLSRLLAGRRRSAETALVGGFVIAVVVFGIEWAQQSIPGRFADTTDVLVATVGWFAAWRIMSSRHSPH